MTPPFYDTDHTPWNAPRILVSGSVAFDTILVFEGHFRDHILPDKVHMLNVAFLAPRLEREFGGTAANIAYSLAGLGSAPVVLGAVGRDGNEQLEHMRKLDIDISGIKRIESQWTPQAFITTDLDDNQITAFHPGAMALAHEVKVSDHLPARWAIVSPNGKQAMMEHSASMRDHGIPFIFDPGQAMPMFNGDELKSMLDGAQAITVNDYECELMCQKMGLTEESLSHMVPALIVTLGALGCRVWVNGELHKIEAAAISRAVDPTGCGDAFRAGLLHGRSHGMDWIASAKLGSVLGAMKIEHSGAQNHPLDRAEIASRHEATYGIRPW
jgi:adenosine kinase